MLAYILALAVVIGSFAIYMAAFFFPEVHRKGDIFWSGIGLFYALVLWFCAGRITGAVLLGQTASVALLVWFGWQSMRLRWEVTPAPQRTQVKVKDQKTGLSKLTGGLTNLLKGKPKAQKQPATKPGTKAEKETKPETTTTADRVETLASETKVDETAAAMESTTSETAPETPGEKTETPAKTAEEAAAEGFATDTSDSEALATEEITTSESTASVEPQETKPDRENITAQETDQSTEDIEDELDEEWDTEISEENPESESPDNQQIVTDEQTIPEENSLDTLEAVDQETQEKIEETIEDQSEAISDSEEVKTKKDQKKPAAKSSTGGMTKLLAPVTGLFGTIQGLFKKDKKDKKDKKAPNQSDPKQSETKEEQPATSLNLTEPEAETTVETTDQIVESAEIAEKLDRGAIANSQSAIENYPSALENYPSAIGETETESETLSTVEDTTTATVDETKTDETQDSEAIKEIQDSLTNPEALEVVIASEDVPTNPEALEVVISSEDFPGETEASEVVTELQDSSTEIETNESRVNQGEVPTDLLSELPTEQNESEQEGETVDPENTSITVEETKNSPEEISASLNPTKLEEPNSFSEPQEQKDQKSNSDG